MNVVFVNYGNFVFDVIKEYKSLNEYVQNHFVKDKNNILLIDEVQLCDKFELAINSFHNSKKYDIYITSSNAFQLSSDLATLFTEDILGYLSKYNN